MGYRHQVISDTMVPSKEKLPEWFAEKYKDVINFENDFWCSYTEYKRYGILEPLHSDIQKVLIELGCQDEIRLVYFADESDNDHPDISHVTITTGEVVELRPDVWVKD